VTWQIFDRAAGRYDDWYSTCRGRLADAAERRMLLPLLRIFQDAHSAVEIGCGTGHFAGFLAEQGLNMIGVDRAPAMLLKARRRFSSLSVILGDAHHLPFRDLSADLAIFVTALEFLEDPICALREAVRIARKGIIALVLNRYSLGGISRRWGPQSRGALLGQARDYSVRELRSALQKAAGSRVDNIIAVSTLFPDGLSGSILRIPLGDVIGCAVKLKP
jgi:SAM-dependent methyltransferase